VTASVKLTTLSETDSSLRILPTLLQDSNHSGLKPPLKWAGGKRWLVPTIRKIWQDHASRCFVEPFCGGLGVTLGLMPMRAVLNDVNPHLINFYQQLQRGLKVSIEMINDEECFYRHRDRFNVLITKGRWKTAEAAQLFYYLNRTGFNGLCRFNQNGEFNVPFGRHNSINYIRDFSRFEELLKNWRFTNTDLARVRVAPEDFIYADPPYDVEFTTYSAGGFTWKDQVRTAELLAKHCGPVLLSNQGTARIVKLYRSLGFKLRHLDGPRRISCTGDRTAAREVLASKNL
jgi:DNA adenine methylase